MIIWTTTPSTESATEPATAATKPLEDPDDNRYNNTDDNSSNEKFSYRCLQLDCHCHQWFEAKLVSKHKE